MEAIHSGERMNLYMGEKSGTTSETSDEGSGTQVRCSECCTCTVLTLSSHSTPFLDELGKNTDVARA